MQKKNFFATSKICKGKCKEQDVNECFHVGRETIHKVHANLRLNSKPIKIMLDSGATVNVVPTTFVKDKEMEYLLKKGKKLDISVYGGKKIRTEGTKTVELINPVNKIKVIASVMIMNEKVQPILSCNLCQKLNLMQFNLDQFDSTVSAGEFNDLKEQTLKDIRKLDIDDSIKEILREFMDVFEERIGEFEGELTLQTEPDAVPIQQPIRSVPFALEKQFKQELEKRIRDNIIEKLEGPNSWLNSYVIERKHSRKLRICLDPKLLNKALINNYHYQVPSLESIINRFANKKAIKFSKLDVRNGFWHCKLNDCLWNAPGQLLIQKTAHGYYTSQQGILSKIDYTIPRGKWGQHYSR